ncbi:MAG: hypothetical protein K2Y21_10520 [Phycisphaerales bacterium]|nr:hypothetical protein [Phycisphaerales bacterium]
MVSQSARLVRIRGGDRDAAALFITSNAAIIRRRYRSQLRGDARRICDSQDLVSTILRRLDRIVLRHKLKAITEAQLWALVYSIGDHACADKGRSARRARRIRADLDRRAHWVTEPGDRTRHDMHSVLRVVHAAGLDSIDKQILLLALRGIAHKTIAMDLGMTPAAVRKRWQRMVAALRDKQGLGALP